MLPLPRRHAWLAAPEHVKESPSDTGATSKEKTKTNPPRAIHSCGRPAQRIKPPTPNPLVPSTPERVKEPPKTKKLKPLVLPLPRRHAWLAGPPANTCSRNRPQNKRQQRPPTKPKTPRAVTLRRHACLTTPVVKPSPPQPPSEQTATTPRSRNNSQGNPTVPPPKNQNPRAITPEVARRRMTTPVVAPRSGLNPPRAPAPTPPDTGAIPKEKKPSSFRNFPRG